LPEFGGRENKAEEKKLEAQKDSDNPIACIKGVWFGGYPPLASNNRFRLRKWMDYGLAQEASLEVEQGLERRRRKAVLVWLQEVVCSHAFL
jgi:hypothetical protein